MNQQLSKIVTSEIQRIIWNGASTREAERELWSPNLRGQMSRKAFRLWCDYAKNERHFHAMDGCKWCQAAEGGTRPGPANMEVFTN